MNGSPARVAVLATPFGFGPASKAYSIGRVLTKEHGVDVRYFGSDSAWDFFAAQEDVRAHRLSSRATEGELDFVAAHDAVVNVLAPELIPSAEIAALTHYVDSLGFMWQEADLPPASLLRQVRAYYAQDLFGSVANLTRLGVRGVTAVSGIVAAPDVPALREPGRERPRGLVNLGGLANPAGSDSARAYLPLVERLLGELGKGSFELLVAMNRANRDLALPGEWPARQLSGADFRAALADCDVVFSSPGMTTLIETSQAGRPYVPLPPQNWSQVVICRHLAGRSALAVWPFLADRYRGIDVRAAELHKAAEVREINLALADEPAFAAEYGVLARRAVEAGEVPEVGAPFAGAHEVAAAVAGDGRTTGKSGNLRLG